MSISLKMFIYGKVPVEEALLQEPQHIEKIFIRKGIPTDTHHNIKELAQQNQIVISYVPEQKLVHLVGRVKNQGFVALRSSIRYYNFFQWLEGVELGSDVSIVILGGLEDPHNVGAVLRSAAASGISAVIVPSSGQAPINATVVKTSAGTAGAIPIIRSHSAEQALKDAALAGFEIFALHQNASEPLFDLSFTKPAAFFIGKEGSGIDPSLLKMCNRHIKIPMQNNVESLNASVSTALMCYEWQRKTGQ